MPIVVNGQTIETDEEGYLANRTEWNEDIAKEMARVDNCELSQNHWEVINFLREYYEEYQIAPAVRVLTKAIGKNSVGQGQQVPVRTVPLRPRRANTPACRSRPAACNPSRAARRSAFSHPLMWVTMSADSRLRTLVLRRDSDARRRRGLRCGCTRTPQP